MMFDQLFERFKKKKLGSVKTLEELDSEFQKVKVKYANLASESTFILLKEYFLTKIELNRDLLEEANIDDPSNFPKIRKAQAENAVYMTIITDIEGMKEQLEI